ncbi:putative urea active transporter 1 [Colletotrichum tanaceti]|uniref:Putative urea active transporter 1 n=1 Tax=Colletotrichum tanaceti TaxID=1306861 RepID=A0A4U6X727_9PEZI|nr:putative urea active transporter 1 [Colletotrichum tanaceti]
MLTSKTGIHIIGSHFVVSSRRCSLHTCRRYKVQVGLCSIAKKRLIPTRCPEFRTAYIYTFVILILCCWLTLKALMSENVGSIGGLYDLVIAAGEQHVVDGKYEGSLLIMTSQQGIFFAIILVVFNVRSVAMDTGYFLKALAASPHAVVTALSEVFRTSVYHSVSVPLMEWLRWVLKPCMCSQHNQE